MSGRRSSRASFSRYRGRARTSRSMRGLRSRNPRPPRWRCRPAAPARRPGQSTARGTWPPGPVVSDSRVTAAALRIDLATIKVNGKDTAAVRQEPRHGERAGCDVCARPASGAAPRTGLRRDHHRDGYRPPHDARGLAPGDLHDQRPPRRVGAAGRGIYPGDLLCLGITDPTGYSFLGSLASHGTRTSSLSLHRSGSAGSGGQATPADRTLVPRGRAFLLCRSPVCGRQDPPAPAMPGAHR